MKHEVISTGTLPKAWKPFRETLGFSSIQSGKDYKRATAIMSQLLDEVGDDESHPLADVLGYLANQVSIYDLEHMHVPDAPPSDVLRFLMEQRGFSQSDLADCAPQSHISENLNGRRRVSRELAKALAAKFEVNVGVFI